jgi:hypothetical protein
MEGERIILGLTEEVTIFGNHTDSEMLRARIDTGATSSSIDEKLAEKLRLGPIIGKKLVKSASGHEMRDLVIVEVIIKGQKIKAQFSIANRNNMTYPALIGQNILIKGRFIVDPLKNDEKESSDNNFHVESEL